MKLTTDQKIAVCQDAIEQINLHKYNPDHVYLQLSFKPGKRIMYQNSNKKLLSLQELVNSDEVVGCAVCAIGSMFVSTVGLFNNFYVDSNVIEPDSSRIKTFLNEAFDPITIGLVEAAYENDVDWSHPDSSYIERIDAVRFGQSFPNKQERLIAILENIIANQGVFVPSQAVKQ